MKMTAWEKVQIARNPERPTSIAYIDGITDDFFELHGDRGFRDDPAIVGGVAYLKGMPITVIAIEKGRTVKEKGWRNFGCPHPEGYRKALRLMKQAEKFRRPILCIVDTQGAYCGVGAEERGQGEAIANNLFEMSGIKTPIVSIIIGEGGSGGALALAVSDKVYMMQYAVYSILTPEGFASILWKDSSLVEQACDVMKLTADDLLQMEIIDDIISEPIGGLHLEDKSIMDGIQQQLKTDFERLLMMGDKRMLKERYHKFRSIGSDID